MARSPRVPRTSVHFGGPIVGIDVETACPDRGAVCAIGVSVVRAGEVFREQHWYLDPRTRFDPRFIDQSIAAWQPPALFADAAPSGPAPLFVAHNAQFDRSQIEHGIACALPFRLACTVAMSRRAFPELPRHNLKSVTAHLRIPLQHHDALSDARASAIIAHQCMVRGAGA